MHLSECHMTSTPCVRWWFSAIRQQAIIWTNVDPDVCCLCVINDVWTDSKKLAWSLVLCLKLIYDLIWVQRAITYHIRRLIIRSHKIFKAEDGWLEFLIALANFKTIWTFNTLSHTFKTLWDLKIRCLIGICISLEIIIYYFLWTSLVKQIHHSDVAQVSWHLK